MVDFRVNSRWLGFGVYASIPGALMGASSVCSTFEPQLTRANTLLAMLLGWVNGMTKSGEGTSACDWGKLMQWVVPRKLQHQCTAGFSERLWASSQNSIP